MTARQTPKRADTALEVINDPAATGPLGDLRTHATGWPANELPFTGTEAMPESEEDRLNSLLSLVGQSGSNAFVSIWKMNEQTKMFEYVAKRGIGEFESDGLPYLARNFGAGEYELKIYNDNKKLHARPRVVISKAAEQVSKQETGGSGGNDIAALGKMMSESILQLGAIMAQNRPKEQSRSEMLQEMLQMKTLFAPTGGSSADPIAMFTALAGIFTKMQPRAENESGISGFIDLAEKFMPMITEAVKREPVAGTAVALPSNAQHQPPAQHPAQPQRTPEQEGAHKMNLYLKGQLMYLCGEAARDSDPGPYAVIIVDKVDREILNQLIADPNWLDALAKYHPNVKKFPEWFNDLYTAITEELEAESDNNLPDNEKSDIQREIGTGENDVSESGHSE